VLGCSTPLLLFAICYLLFGDELQASRRASTCSGMTRYQVEVVRHKTRAPIFRASGEIETIKVHHLGPGSHKLLHELLLRIAAAVDLGKST
jgi:hypothetical protein